MLTAQRLIDRNKMLIATFKAAQKAGSVKESWDRLETVWNPDGTLDVLTAYRDGRRVYRLSFTWNADGSLHSVSKI